MRLLLEARRAQTRNQMSDGNLILRPRKPAETHIIMKIFIIIIAAMKKAYIPCTYTNPHTHTP